MSATPEQVLGLPLEPNDSGATTVRGYLVSLLAAVWEEGEGFSGKRPFGTSGWAADLYQPLVGAGFVPGALDEDGYLDDFPSTSRLQANELIAAAIKSLGGAA